MPQPVKVWYLGPMFRHDRPQHGRYRQFQQFGCEVLGEDDAVMDAQLILIGNPTVPMPRLMYIWVLPMLYLPHT